MNSIFRYSINNVCFTEKTLQPEGDLTTHRLDVNPEAAQFRAGDAGATEGEYLRLLSALAGIFKPTHLIETGTWNGDGAAALLDGAGPGAVLWTFNDGALPASALAMLAEAAASSGSAVECLQMNTVELMRGRVPRSWGDITGGKATFAFLDTSIAHRAEEFDYISDPANGVLDFSRPLCVCVHDMSRYRHPSNHETDRLAAALRQIGETARRRGWQALRLHQSRGMYVLTRHPEAAGIDGVCIVPEELLSEQDVRDHSGGSDPYLITEYYPLLAALVRRIRPRRVLEIGVRYGYSLGVILDASPSIEAAFAVDTTAHPLPVNSGATAPFQTRPNPACARCGS